MNSYMDTKKIKWRQGMLCTFFWMSYWILQSLNCPCIHVWRQSIVIEFRIGYFFTTKRIRDISIVYSIKPQFDHSFFFICWFMFFVQIENLKLFLFWFAELAEQFHVHNLYKRRKSTKNWFSNFGFIYGSVSYSFSCKI
jgi:hypothetical protein